MSVTIATLIYIVTCLIIGRIVMIQAQQKDSSLSDNRVLCIVNLLSPVWVPLMILSIPVVIIKTAKQFK